MSPTALPRGLGPSGLCLVLSRAADVLSGSSVRLGARGRLAATLHRAPFGRSFDREHLAMLWTREPHAVQQTQLKESAVALWCNTRRLEKGLIMQPWLPVFGEGFIKDMVRLYGKALALPGFSLEELAWAGAVLAEYFAVVGEAPVVDRAREAFRALPAPPEVEDPQRPGPIALRPQGAGHCTEVSFKARSQLLVQRRSVRWYLDRPVPHALETQTLEAAVLAPSA